MVTMILSITCAVLAAALLVLPRASKGVVPPKIEPLSPANDMFSTTEVMEKVVSIEGNLQRQLDRLTLAIAEGIERTDRAEKRVQKTVQGAKRLVAAHGLEHGGLDAEVAELAERNGEDIEEAEVLEVREVVEPDQPVHGWPDALGVSDEDYARMRSE